MDENLKLAIISQLISNDLLTFDRDSFIKNNKSKNVFSSDEPNEDIRNFFLSLNLNSYDLNKISHFSYISGEPVIVSIWPYWDGEDDYFHIKSLNGIEICPNIKTIEIDMYSYINDFKPLENLKKLEEVYIEYNWEPAPVETLEPFIKMKNLKKLSLINAVLSQNINLKSATENLKKKGIETNIILYP